MTSERAPRHPNCSQCATQNSGYACQRHEGIWRLARGLDLPPGLIDAARDAQQINYNEVAMPDPPPVGWIRDGGDNVRAVGHFTEVREEPEGLVASGSWCAPSADIYNLSQSYDTSSLPPTPDELPVVNSEQITHEWIVRTEYEKWYHPTEEAALARFNEVVEQNDSMEGVWIEERTTTSRIITASHGTLVRPEPDPDTTKRVIQGLAAMFPEVAVRRGGIQYPNHWGTGPYSSEREGD